MMNDLLPALLAWLMGGALGVFFYGGLWWTVKQYVASPRVAWWFLASFLLRTGVTVTGFYRVGDGQWQRFLLCLAGFFMARLLITWLARTPGHQPPQPIQENRHAP